MVKTILIVEDQKGIRLLMKDVLESDGYVVMTASTGKEALDFLRKDHFAGVIMDYKLPIHSGVDVLDTLSSEGEEHIPALLVTGMPETVLQELADLDLDATVLGKPFDIEEFRNTIHELF